MKKTLDFYRYQFTHLRTDKKEGIEAPHKPVLLLSIIQEFEEGRINQPRIYLTPELVSTFRTIWNALVETSHDARFALPFYHLRSAYFWRLIPNPGCEIWVQSPGAMRSISNLETAVDYAEIDPELATFLIKNDNREILKQAILHRYFPLKNSDLPSNATSAILSASQNDILNLNPADYAQRILDLKETLGNEAFQEEIFIRGAIFKREIPKGYDLTCCMSGFRIDTKSGISMVDACHIVPFSISNNDTISNGITLCPNLHRAFDRGLVSIDNDFKILVSNAFREKESPYSLKILAGKEILLPKSSDRFPSVASLKWHQENRFLG